MIIFELILTTFVASVIFWGSWDNSENWLKLKLKPLFAILAFPNLWNAPYVYFELIQLQAAGIYYIPWPAKQLLPKTLNQFCLPKNGLEKMIWLISGVMYACNEI